MDTTPKPTPLFRAIVLLIGAFALFARLGSPLLLGAYDDDAFYYFQIARNIVAGHGSTFDTLHRTNGYHPLWMAVVVALTFLSSGKGFFILLQCVAFASFVITFFAARSAFRYASDNLALTEVAAAVIALQTLLLIHGGMEITLTLPLAMLLCAFRLRPAFRWTAANAALYGLLTAAIILSRLDSVFFVAPLFALELLSDRTANIPQKLIAPVTTAIPVGLYAMFNHLYFQTWTPVSAQAKQLRLHHGFSLAPLQTSLYFFSTPFGFLVIVPAILATLACIITALTARKPAGGPRSRILAISLLLLPLLQLTVFCFTSDWQVWSWYLYSFVLAMAGAFLFLFDRFPTGAAFARADVYVLSRGVVILLAVFYALSIAAGPPTPFWTTFAHNIEFFSRTHDGIYAMGDCAGTPGYLVHQPIIQLEGLVMDEPFLDNIRQQRNLNDVLRSYHVRYYITGRAALINGCYQVREPSEGGPNAAHMSGTFCQQPVADFPLRGAHLDIFDLNSSGN